MSRVNSRRRKNFGSAKRHRKSNHKVYPQFIGRVQMTREGFIFVIPEGGEEDIFVKAAKTRRALNGDIVRVALTREGGKDRRREGEVVEILERSTKPFVGIFHMIGAQAWAIMQSKTMPYDIELDPEQALDAGAQKGMKIAVQVTGWDRGDHNPKGTVVDVLGLPGENETEMHAILAEFDLPYRFTQEVEKAAESIPSEITKEDMKGRTDLRDTFTFTIDPTDAKDFDDALSFKQLDNGNFEVGVHIADVSHYVQPGSPVDKEARERGTSVYLVDRTVPMLPEKLCNNLCSLRPGEDKLTFSTIFEMTPQAAVKKRRICRTIIRSDVRLDYDGAQKIIEGDAPDTPVQTVTAIQTLYALSEILKQKRFDAGAINFDRPEMKVEVDEKGRPVNVYQRISREANFLIEEFMLLANRTVAEFIATAGKFDGAARQDAKTFVYRIHDEPNFEKINSLGSFAKGFGYKMAQSSSGREAADSLRELLSSSKGKPENAAFENLALRAMSKAKYSTDNIGHYGLAFKFYTHFTSPIRRYPDTLVHRLLTIYMDGGKSADKEKYEQLCEHLSAREQLAADAERASVKYKLIEFMEDKVGQTFEGTISGITEWGMYVEIEPTKIEGMIPLREIHSDFYEFDEAHYKLVGKRTRRQYRLGDGVKIKVKNANLEQRLLDYELIEDKPVKRTKKDVKR